jgi:hypothetical protein
VAIAGVRCRGRGCFVTSRTYGVVVVIWVAAAVLAVGWSLPRSEMGIEAGEEALPVLAPGERTSSASFETEDTLPSALKSVAIEPVQGEWRGPGGHGFHVAIRTRSEAGYRYRQFGRAVFDLTLRLDESEVSQEPCTSCHQGQGRVRGRVEGEAEGVHQNVQPTHPDQAGAQCLTCHDAEDVSRLRLERGETVSIDHAYRLCAQCHFPQVESWAYGAHGKRLVGWRGRRVVMGCADCHDPHRPATELRLPMAGLSLGGDLLPEGEGGHGGEPEGDAHD